MDRFVSNISCCSEGGAKEISVAEGTGSKGSAPTPDCRIISAMTSSVCLTEAIFAVLESEDIMLKVGLPHTFCFNWAVSWMIRVLAVGEIKIRAINVIHDEERIPKDLHPN